MITSVAAGTEAASVVTAWRWREHHTVVTLCFAAAFICYIDRANIAVAAIAMKEERDISHHRVGPTVRRGRNARVCYVRLCTEQL